MIFLVQFGINKHSHILERLQIFCSLRKIHLCLFIPNCTRNRSITYTNNYYCFCFLYFEIIQIQSRRPNNIQKTSLQSYNTQIKILAQLNRASNNPAQELRSQACLNVWILHFLCGAEQISIDPTCTSRIIFRGCQP